MTYIELLDFKNQKIVDSIYQKIKEKDDNEELTQAYQQIKERNTSKVQATHYQYQVIMDHILKIIGIIGMIIFAILFLITGSLILASILYWLNAIMGEAMIGLQNWMIQWGTSVYDSLFSVFVGMSGAELIGINEQEFLQGFYILGATTLFVIMFSILYIVSMIRNEKKEKEKTSLVEKELTIEKCYEVLQCQQDDSWKYIRYSLKRNLKRKNKDFFDKYFQAYIQIFYSYRQVESSFKKLDTFQKIKLIAFSILNTLKNLLGSFAKPIFFSAAAVWTFIRMFTYTDTFTLKTVLTSSFGEKIYGFLQGCYEFVSKTIFQPLIQNENLELSYFISFCIVISLIAVVYNWSSKKFIESYRQMKRRMNYYSKINNGVYDKDMKYEKSYFYGIEFTVLVVMCIAIIGIPYLDQNYDPLLSVPFEQKEFVKEGLMLKDNIEDKIENYAKEKGHKLIDEKVRDGYWVVYRSTVKTSEEQELGYLCVEVYPSLDMVNDTMNTYQDVNGLSWKHHESLGIDYYVSHNGFLIRDKGVIITMSNNEQFSTPGYDLVPIEPTLTKSEINNLITQIGYVL